MKKTLRILALLSASAVSTVQADNLHIAHCLAGCPTGTPAGNDTIVREIYALSTNKQTRLADWVAYKVSQQGIGISTHLPRNWQPEPFLDDSLDAGLVQRYEQAGFTRGSFAPLNTFAGTMHWSDTTLFSNMAPQKQSLRLGPWFRLEQAERTLAAQLQEPIYVVTGPIYEIASLSDKAPMPDLLAPTAFYKVIALADGSVSAFILHQDLPQHASHCDQLSTVASIEQATGLDLFPREPAFPVTSLNERLGCR